MHLVPTMASRMAIYNHELLMHGQLCLCTQCMMCIAH